MSGPELHGWFDGEQLHGDRFVVFIDGVLMFHATDQRTRIVEGDLMGPQRTLSLALICEQPGGEDSGGRLKKACDEQSLVHVRIHRLLPDNTTCQYHARVIEYAEQGGTASAMLVGPATDFE